LPVWAQTAYFILMQQNQNQPNSSLLYPFMLLLAAAFTFIGYNFGGVLGGFVGFCISCVGNAYAITIKQHE
jgi:hypothetical protein